ncbi:acyltransferase [Nocardioides convexus]|uniref:acyltransferase family protein n=1 Tax=Nocardioides convexus TaxID=2712224 RepID=UPI002418A3D9|nr:acyltransferase [Nocardioides convexus]
MRTPTPARLAGLDLLRGIAVLLVMLRHALPGAFPGAGVVGVVMFFTLSGYLITGVLARGTGLRRFYARRALRLVPALVVLVVVVVVVTLVLDPLGEGDLLGVTVLVALTWTANLPGVHTSAATFHLWTLATEEQFYLVWPWALLLAVRRRAGPVLAGAAVLCLLACVATVVWLREDPDLAYALPTSWAVCFVVGGATWWYRDRLRPWVAGWPAPALAGLLVLGTLSLRGSALTYLLAGPAVAGLTAVLLLTWGSRARLGGTALRPLVWLGTVSYAAYLWNYPLTLWLRPSLDSAAGPVAAVLTVLAAAASWYAVEQPVAAWWARREELSRDAVAAGSR